MISFLKLIRLPNLLIMALSMYLMRWFLIIPSTSQTNFEFSLHPFHFFLLTLSVLLISAAGYIINDYFDISADLINKPKKIIINKKITRRQAILLHLFFSISGAGTGIYISYVAGSIWLSGIFLFAILLLWLYSASFQKIFLLGNFSIALLSALTPMLPWIFEVTSIHLFYHHSLFNFKALNHIFFFYFVFAFLITLIREIIKDMEDIEGDKMFGYQTLPVVSGLKSAKNMVMSISFLLLGFIVYFQLFLYSTFAFPVIFYLVCAVQMPMLALLYLIYKATLKKDFTRLSLLCKIIMLAGILSVPLIYYFCNCIPSC